MLRCTEKKESQTYISCFAALKKRVSGLYFMLHCVKKNLYLMINCTEKKVSDLYIMLHCTKQRVSDLHFMLQCTKEILELYLMLHCKEAKTYISCFAALRKRVSGLYSMLYYIKKKSLRPIFHASPH